MLKIRVAVAVICFLLLFCSCDTSVPTNGDDVVACSVHDEYHEAVYNTKLSSLYFLDGNEVKMLDETTYSHYDLSALPEPKKITDNWLIAEDGSVYKLDIGTFFREDYCARLYQLYWDEVSADRCLELYATDTVLKTETLSGRLLCSVKNGTIEKYMFLENADYSEYLELVELGGELYTCDFYPQIGELHLIKIDPFESNEDIVNEIADEDAILFIRHQIWPETGYWSMTGLYVFTESGKVHTVYNGEIMETSENILDISFKHGNFALVKKDLTVFSERTHDGENWTNVIKVVVAELLHNMIALDCDGNVLCCDSNAHLSEISEWHNVKDIALLNYKGAFYPVALTFDGTFLVTSDNPFAVELSGFVSVDEFVVAEKGTENFALYALCDDGTVLVCK